MLLTMALDVEISSLVALPAANLRYGSSGDGYEPDNEVLCITFRRRKFCFELLFRSTCSASSTNDRSKVE